MGILLVDPNEIQTNTGSDPRFKSFVPEYQNMTPYVEFFAIRKSEVAQYLSNNTVINDSSFNKVNLLGFDDSNSKNLQYTARWTDDINNGANRESVEGFGIKSIDIKTNASQVPVVDVTFIDIKGTSLFSQGSKSKYGVLLDWPPPIFVLRIKGVYGLLTEYRLNLLRTATEFNGETGNFEIKANFIGYNIAPLTDISIGYLMAVHDISSDLDSSIDINQSTEPKSVFELVMKGDILYNRLDNYKNNSKDLKKSNELKDDLEQLLNNTSNFIDILSSEDSFKNYYNNTNNVNLDIVVITKNELSYTIDISFDFKNIGDDGKVKLSKLIMDYYNETIKQFIENNKKLDIKASDIFIKEFGESNQNLNIFNSINDNEDDINLVPFINIEQNDDSIKYFQINYFNFNKKLETKYDELSSNKKKISEKIRQDIGDVAEVKIFNPTIKNITNIVTTDIGRLFNEILIASQKTPHTKDDNIRSSSPFPEVWERKSIGNNGENKLYKIYPGSKVEYKNWGEVELVEKIITALSRQANLIKKLDELQAIQNGDSKWTPINPLETQDNNISENEYFTNRLNKNNIFETITKRYISARDYTYKGLMSVNDDILNFVAKCEARNLVYAINTEEKLLLTLKNTADKYTTNNLSNIINLLPSDSTYRNPNYTSDSIQINNIELTNKLNNLTTTSNIKIIDSDNVKSLINQDDTNDVSQLIEGIKTTNFNWVEKKFKNKAIEMSNQNLLVFLDNKKLQPSSIPTPLTIDSDYNWNDSDFFAVQLDSIIQSCFFELKKSKGETITYVEFFNYVNNNNIFLDPIDDKKNINNYKFYFPALIELPNVYLLYMGYLLSNSNKNKTTNSYLNLYSSLSSSDIKILVDNYNEFISNNTDILLDSNFQDKYNEAKTDEQIFSLINTYIDNDDYNLMDKVYLLNNSRLGFGIIDNNNLINLNIKIPEPYIFLKSNITYNSIDLNFKSINSNDNIDQKYFKYFFVELSKSINNVLKQNDKDKINSDNNGFGDDDIKLQIYYDIKKLYDTWLSIPSNQSGGKNLYDDLFGGKLSDSFKFIDRTMSTVASEAIMDYRNFVEDAKNFDLSIYTILTKLYSHNNFLFFPLQTSMVFSEKFEESEWQSCFKLNIDKINDNKSKPAFVCMYVDSFSSNLNNNSEDFPDDGMSFLPTDKVDDKKKISEDFTNSKNNIFVIKVEHGKENQSYFSGIKLNTNEHNNTHEALKLADLMSRKNADSNPLSKGQNLFEVFSQRSYSCTVEVPLGNLCIQPIMYFELVGVPMFYGGYLITNVEHSMSADNNKIKTRFKGTRIGRVGVPFVTDAAVKYLNTLNVDPELSEVNDLSNSNEINPFKLAIYNDSGNLLI
jgi:hypothetical protein